MIGSSSNKWLIGVAAVVGVLVILSVIVAVSREQKDVVTYAERTPEGVVQGYLQSIWDKEYKKAYDYLGDDLKRYCTYQHLRDTTTGTPVQDMRVSLAGTQAVDDRVEVEVRITQVHVALPFTPKESSYTQRLTVGRQGDPKTGDWRFVEPPWPMPDCPDWNDPRVPRKPVPAAPPA